ncbi:MAG: M24 family metallopeptidase [Maricaulaceae bacterium]
MSISRRGALTSLIGVGAAGSLASCSQNGHKSTPSNTKRLDLPQSPQSLLFNRVRAAELMEREKVDLIICANPTNIYYLTNQRPMTYRLGMNDYAYATLSSVPMEAPTYIVGRFGVFLGGAADTDIIDQLNVKMFSIPADPEAFAKLTDINDIINAPVNQHFYPRLHQNHDLAPHIQRKRDEDAKLLGEHYASAEAALIKQIFETDLPNRTIAIDNPKLRETIAKSGLDVRIVDGERLVRKIRLQKTAAELELIRYAVTANAQSAREAAQSVRAGASLQDIRSAFAASCGNKMSCPVWMVVDGIVPELIPGEIKDGRTLMVDCVSQFQGYHGDFGRTVCAGEPSREMQKIIDTLSHVWDRILPELKAGKKYSEIYALSAKLFAETQVDANFAINPHSVGLNHTDEPSKNDFGLWEKDDIELVENMVLSVDMPVLDNGLGGSAHLEDLVLIGKDGPELLNTSEDRFIVV